MSVFPAVIQMQAAVPLGFAAPVPRTPISTYVLYVVVLALLGVVLYGAYWFFSSGYFTSGGGVPFAATDQAPNPLDGKTPNRVSGAAIPAGVQDYGIQFWCYIKDWDYKYGQEKIILQRGDPTSGGIVGPRISLGANENTLNVSVSIYPTDNSAQQSEPAPANHGGSAVGDIFTCSVENVPLQTWFPISVTVFQRNLDVYLNGNLVKSCVLPGVPKTAAGDIEIGPDGGFSGYVCNLYSYARSLTPQDAKSFYTADTNCKYLTPKTDNELTGNLFGYTVKFGLFDRAGKAIKQFIF